MEGGAAIDAYGREIVIEKPVVQKLSGLQGYKGLTGGKASLCVRCRKKDVKQEKEKTLKATKKEISSEGQTASGILEIPMDAYMNKGKACFSEEIVHGLGYGNVCVTVGAKTEGDSVIIGDTSLFAREGPEVTWLLTAVKIFPERGSFKVAVCLKGEMKAVVLTIQWYAFKA